MSRPSPDPEPVALYAKAVARLRVTLRIDQTTLKLLRQAAEEGGAAELSAFGWALGVVPDDLVQGGPVVAAEAYDLAAQHNPADPAIAFGAGLANVGAFSRRRGLSSASRRGFTQAAKLEPDNLLPHLTVAAVRQSTSDPAAAHQALDRAARAERFGLYDSPLAAMLSRESPWLAQSWSVLWPDRTATAVYFVIENEARIARQLQRKSEDPRPPIARMEALARRMVELAPARAPETMLATGTTIRVLAARARALNDDAALSASHELAEQSAELLRRRRELGHKFEAAILREMGLAATGTAAGVAGTVIGLIRSRRRWPPPWPPLMLPGRTIALASVVAGVVAAGSVLVTNPTAANYRRVVERRLLAEETRLLTATLDAYRQRLGELPVV